MHFDLELYVVEHKEFGFGTKKCGVAQSCGREVGLSALCDAARVALIALHGRRFNNVTTQNDRCIVCEGVNHRGAVVGHEDHVGFVNTLPACDRRAVKHFAVFEKVFIDLSGGNTDVLLFTARVGKAQIYPANIIVFDQIERAL